MSPPLFIWWTNVILWSCLTRDRNVCVFTAPLMARTHIFLGNSSDDIKPARNPIALYQSQQVDIIQGGVRRWAQIFAHAGKLGSWVGAWERAEESRCNRETQSTRTQQQVQQTTVYCNRDIYEIWHTSETNEEPVFDCSEETAPAFRCTQHTF